MEKGKAMQISQPVEKRLSELTMALTQMAMMRATTVDALTLGLYSRRLARERHEDVIAAIEKIADMPRDEGQPAFPEIGLILNMTGMMATARHNREKFKPCHKNGCQFDGYKKVRTGDGTFDVKIIPCECRNSFYGERHEEARA
jgi:hypothetical protein